MIDHLFPLSVSSLNIPIRIPFLSVCFWTAYNILNTNWYDRIITTCPISTHSWKFISIVPRGAVPAVLQLLLFVYYVWQNYTYYWLIQSKAVDSNRPESFIFYFLQHFKGLLKFYITSGWKHGYSLIVVCIWNMSRKHIIPHL